MPDGLQMLSMLSELRSVWGLVFEWLKNREFDTRVYANDCSVRALVC